MTNIVQKSKTDNVHSHIDDAFKIIEEYLPNPYVEKVMEKAIGTKVSRGTVRNVRNRIKSVKLENHIPVIQWLVEVAKENKVAIERLKETIT